MDLNKNALVTLEDLKNFLGIDKDDTSKDLILTVYINGLSDFIQGPGNSILKQDYIEKYKGTGTQELVLNHRPINIISKLILNNSNVTDYEIDKNSGILYRDYGWGMSGTTLPMMHDRINRVYKTIKVEYNAGYENVPSDLTMLMLALIKNQYSLDTTGSLKSYKISDVSKTWRDTTKELSPEYKSILLKYKVVHI